MMDLGRPLPMWRSYNPVDPYSMPTLADWPGGKIHGVNVPSTGGLFARSQGQVRDLIAKKLDWLQNGPQKIQGAIMQKVAELQAQQAAQPPMNLGGTPSGSTTPGVNSALTAPTGRAALGASLTPGVNTALTAEQQRALMFQGGA